jgi:glyoxylase-like metal-dependent hydrolase (beta-lactamase superfamily II)
MRKAALALAAALASASAPACDMFEFREVRASRHVRVFEAAEGTTAVVNGNIVAIAGDDAILLVDTGQLPSVARRVLARLAALSPKPVRYIVNTHWHGDHMLANFVFKERFPEARILATAYTIAEAAKFYPDYAAKNATRMATVAAGMKKRRDEAKSEDEREWLGRTLACVERMGPEIEATRYVAPGQAVDGELAIDLGGVTAVVKHIGAGNTPGDLIVWVPEDKLVATGDMVVAPVPYAIGSPLDEWSKTLGFLLALGAATYVPGHGPVMHDDTYVRDVRDLIGATRSQLEAMRAQGVEKAQAEARLDTSGFAGKYVTTAMRRQAFHQFFVKAAVAKMGPAPAPAAPAR